MSYDLEPVAGPPWDSALQHPAPSPTTSAGATPATPSTEPEPMLRWFRYRHLPEHLQASSRPFCALAEIIVETIPRSAERTVALRKLLEAKDAAVRAALPPEAP